MLRCELGVLLGTIHCTFLSQCTCGHTLYHAFALHLFCNSINWVQGIVHFYCLLCQCIPIKNSWLTVWTNLSSLKADSGRSLPGATKFCISKGWFDAMTTCLYVSSSSSVGHQLSEVDVQAVRLELQTICIRECNVHRSLFVSVIWVISHSASCGQGYIQSSIMPHKRLGWSPDSGLLHAVVAISTLEIGDKSLFKPCAL